jgi:phosphomannomutase/phosphoglucomutase
VKSIPADIFRRYDIRGVVGRDLNETLVADVGRTIGSEARARGIEQLVVGRDGRLSSPGLSAALCSGIRASGVDVIDIDVVPTPLLYFAAYNLAEGSGVMLTGSHNPPEYNGIKIMLGGDTLHGEAIQGLYRRMVEGDYCAGQGGYRQASVLGHYLQEMAAAVDLPRPLKIVVDCGSGVGSISAPALFDRLGCEVVPLFCEVDGHFPHHHPDPNQPENLQALVEAVQQHKADIGFAFDGDGDRLGVVAGNGEIIWPDRIMMLLARDLLSRHPGAKVIYDIKCSRNLGRLITQYGGHPEMWRTGHSLLKARMQERGALLAGEMSGHLFLKEGWYGCDDALYAAARLLTLVAADKRGSEALFAELPDMLNTPELHVPMGEGEHYRLMERLMDETSRFGDAEVTTIDGLRVDYEEGWGLVRASNTTPMLVLRFEAENAAAMARIQHEFKMLLHTFAPTLSLPF